MSAGNLWYEERAMDDATARTLAEEIYGPERAQFAEGMAILDQVLRGALGTGTTGDVNSAKMAIANHAFSLIWSSWTEAAAGRYSAATHHWRSIEESPQYLKALTVKADLVEKFKNHQLRSPEVMRTVRDALESEKPGAGEEWIADRKFTQYLHRFSHINLTGIEVTLPRVQVGGNMKAIVKFGGGIHSGVQLRRISIALAENVRELLIAVCFAFHDIEAVGSLWDEVGEPYVRVSKPVLAEAATEIQVLKDEVRA